MLENLKKLREKTGTTQRQLAEAIGVAPFFVVDGLACLALGLVLYLPKSIRALDK